MGDESSKYVMDVELAIQRELAYRRKIFLSQLQTDKDFKTDPVPLERIAHVIFLISCEHYGGFFPSRMVNVVVPSSSSTVSPSRTPTSKSLSSSSPRLCGVKREAPPSGSESLQPQQRQSSNSKPCIQINQIKEANQQRWCKVCNTGCTSAELFKQHLCGKKHKVELGKLECARKDSGDLPKQPKYC
ncbi:hypothetical protein Pint_16175 [Pistacia integerrima]|uniref:Uncharacterized protein n=1 Tax=Pistacia integerrima TaxID=434235 RepID=A0ACC0ZD80_9ROSI|nr:hypothetical protein Pint_16175 [Pistacia integerrima]